MILAVDLGKRTSGLATTDSSLASPYKTLHHKTTKEVLIKIISICNQLAINIVVVGFVEGKIKIFFENFAHDLKKAKPELEVILWDETLTSRQATESMVKLGIKKKKRAEKEHEIAAAIILQSYLDSRE